MFRTSTKHHDNSIRQNGCGFFFHFFFTFKVRENVVAADGFKYICIYVNSQIGRYCCWNAKITVLIIRWGCYFEDEGIVHTWNPSSTNINIPKVYFQSKSEVNTLPVLIWQSKCVICVVLLLNCKYRDTVYCWHLHNQATMILLISLHSA